LDGHSTSTTPTITSNHVVNEAAIRHTGCAPSDGHSTSTSITMSSSSHVANEAAVCHACGCAHADGHSTSITPAIISSRVVNEAAIRHTGCAPADGHSTSTTTINITSKHVVNEAAIRHGGCAPADGHGTSTSITTTSSSTRVANEAAIHNPGRRCSSPVDIYRTTTTTGCVVEEVAAVETQGSCAMRIHSPAGPCWCRVRNELAAREPCARSYIEQHGTAAAVGANLGWLPVLQGHPVHIQHCVSVDSKHVVLAMCVDHSMTLAVDRHVAAASELDALEVVR
jgi:hypothetical protein